MVFAMTAPESPMPPLPKCPALICLGAVLALGAETYVAGLHLRAEIEKGWAQGLAQALSVSNSGSSSVTATTHSLVWVGNPAVASRVETYALVPPSVPSLYGTAEQRLLGNILAPRVAYTDTGVVFGDFRPYLPS
jgi:hypothetical protein